MSRKEGLDLYKDLDVQQSQNDEDIKLVYDEWAARYDDDNDALLGTVSQPNCVKLLSSHLQNKSASIIDVGCGTGLVGSYLSQAGFHHFDGIDISQEMLSKAKSRGYQKLLTGSLNERLAIADNHYDACLCVGVFTHGHVHASALHELARITRSGGYVCFTVNEGVYDEYGFEDVLDKLEADKIWSMIHFQKDDYMTKKQVDGYYGLAAIL